MIKPIGYVFLLKDFNMMSWACRLRSLLLVAYIKSLQLTLILCKVSNDLCDRGLVILALNMGLYVPLLVFYMYISNGSF